MRLVAALLFALTACGQTSEFAPAPTPPTGRLLPGLEQCGAMPCSPDAGSCFTSLFDEQRYCTGANDRTACDVITCDAPARCWCFLSNPPQCGCAIVTTDH